MMKMMKYSVVVLMMAQVFLGGSVILAQTRQEVEAKLQTMTPEEIDQKLKEYNVTRQQAEAKAKEYGVDLQTYLQRKSPASAATPVATPSTNIVIVPPTAPVMDSVMTSPAVVHKKTPDAGGAKFFGYEVFERTPAGFEATASGPADPQYILGPTDAIRISIWGQTEIQYDLTLDNEGKVFIPTIGPVILSGNTLEQANARLLKQFAKSYAGLVSQPATSFLDVTLSKLKPKRVFIMGEVENPGGYTVGSYANVFSSLFAVGGPKTTGSMRDIRVLRNGKTIAHVDLYGYVCGATTISDIRVQNNDIIFVPRRGRTVTLTGEINNAATYELLGGENFKSLLGYAGGLKASAYLDHVQFTRIKPFAERSGKVLEDRYVTDMNIAALVRDNSGDIPVYDGDIIAVRSILDIMKNFVVLNGEVWRPGSYELSKVKTVKGLLSEAGGVMPKAYLETAHISRLNDDEVTRTVIPINLNDLLAGKVQDLPLQPKDEIVVYGQDATELKVRFVDIYGEVKRPGRFEFRDNMNLRDLILLAGGYTEIADLTTAEVSRLDPRGIPGDTLAVFLYPRLTNNLAETNAGRKSDLKIGDTTNESTFLLQHRDAILIRPNPHFVPQRLIEVIGEVQYPGTYTLRRQNERLSEVVSRAGGLTKYAFLDGGHIIRNGNRLNIDFVQLFKNDNKNNDFIMRPGDRIVLPQVPNTISVSGEVNNQSFLGYVVGQKLWDYVDRAGGLTDSSNFILLRSPSGYVEKFHTDFFFKLFESNPVVQDGSLITVTKIPAPREDQKVDYTAVIKDTFAIIVSSLTIIVLANQIAN